MVRLASAALVLASTASFVSGFGIIAPSAANWWVAKSLNVLQWDCQNSPPAQNFTIYIANKDPKILVAPLAIIPIEANADCSKEITQDQSAQPAGTGYTIIFTDILNPNNIYTTSEEFEIKALGSPYPSQVSSSAASASATSGTPKPTGNGALGLNVEPGWILAGLGALLGLAAA